jgi:hypothetical protein
MKIFGINFGKIKKKVIEISHKGLKEQPSLKELFEHKCSCGKTLQEHKHGSGSHGWDTLKMYYDLGTCDFGDRTVNSRPNGFGKFSTYFYMNQKDADILKNSTDFHERRRTLEKNYS